MNDGASSIIGLMKNLKGLNKFQLIVTLVIIVGPLYTWQISDLDLDKDSDFYKYVSFSIMDLALLSWGGYYILKLDNNDKDIKIEMIKKAGNEDARDKVAKDFKKLNENGA